MNKTYLLVLLSLLCVGSVCAGVVYDDGYKITSSGVHDGFLVKLESNVLRLCDPVSKVKPVDAVVYEKEKYEKEKYDKDKDKGVVLKGADVFYDGKKLKVVKNIEAEPANIKGKDLYCYYDYLTPDVKFRKYFDSSIVVEQVLSENALLFDDMGYLNVEFTNTTYLNVSASLKVYYPMDYNGDVSADLSQNGYHATLYGSPQFNSTGDRGGFFMLDGSDDYIEYSGAPLGASPSAATISAWVRPETTGSSEFIVQHGELADGFGDTSQISLLSNGSSLGGYTRATSQGSATGIYDPVPYTTSQWYHLAIVVDASNMTVYVNGTKIGSAAKQAQANHDNFIIGADHSDGGSSTDPEFLYGGDVDDVRVYDTAFSDSEVMDLYLENSSQGFVSSGTTTFKFVNTTEWFNAVEVNHSYTSYGGTGFKDRVDGWSVNEAYTFTSDDVLFYLPFNEDDTDVGPNNITFNEADVTIDVPALWNDSYQFSLDGVSQVNATTDLFRPDETNGFYCGAWVKTDFGDWSSPGTYMQLFTTSDTTNGNYIAAQAYYENAGGTEYFSMSIDTTTDVWQTGYVADWGYDEWVHLGFGINTSHEFITKNGEIVVDATYDGELINNMSYVWVGSDFSYGASWNGSIDEFFCVNRTPTVEEIKEVYVRGTLNGEGVYWREGSLHGTLDKPGFTNESNTLVGLSGNYTHFSVVTQSLTGDGLYTPRLSETLQYATTTTDVTAPTVTITAPLEGQVITGVVNTTFTVVDDVLVTGFVDVNNKLKAYYRMDDFAGSTVEDYTGLHDASLNGDAAIVNGGKFGKAVSLDGAGDYVLIPAGGYYSYTSPGGANYTAAGWFKTSTANEGCLFCLSGSGGVGDRFKVFMDADGNITMDMNGGGGSAWIKSPTSYADGEWHHYAAVRDSLTDAKLYVDGVLVGSASMTGGYYGIDNTNPAFLGIQSGGGIDFEGLIDDTLIMYSHAVTENEIKALYGEGNTSVTATRNDGTFMFSEGRVNVTAYGQDVNGNIDTTFSDFVVDSLYPTVELVSPTPTEGEVVSDDFVTVNVTVGGGSDVSSFIDFNNSLLAWWRMDDLDGSGNPTDYLHVNNGTAQNDANYTLNGKLGGGFAFDGDSDYVNVSEGYTNTIKGDDTHTVTYWVKQDSDDSSGAIHVDMASQDIGYFVQMVLSSDNLYWGVGGSYRTYSHTLNAGEWYHIALVKNGSGNEGTLYVNGGVKTPSGGTIGSTPDVASDLLMGKYHAGSGWDLNGTLDDVLLFDRVLSVDEIVAVYSSSNYSKNFTDLTEGDYTLKAYAQDSAANVNVTETRNFSVGSGVIEYVFVENNTADPVSPATYDPSGVYNFTAQIGASETATVVFDFNGTNHTATNQSGTFNVTLGPLTAGTYTTTWHANTSTTTNHTTPTTYVINKANTINANIIGTSDQEYGQDINVQVSENNQGDADITYYLYLNGTQVTNPYTTSLAAGTYTWTANSSTGENYTSTVLLDTDTQTINKNDTYTLNITVDPSTTVNSGTETTVTAYGCPSQNICTLYKDSSNVSNPHVQNLTVGYHEYEYVSNASQNYTKKTTNVTITVQDTYFYFSDETQPESPVAYETPKTYTWSVKANTFYPISEVLFEFNGVNESPTSNTSTTFTYQTTNLSVGNYTYKWYGNNTYESNVTTVGSLNIFIPINVTPPTLSINETKTSAATPFNLGGPYPLMMIALILIIAAGVTWYSFEKDSILLRVLGGVTFLFGFVMVVAGVQVSLGDAFVVVQNGLTNLFGVLGVFVGLILVLSAAFTSKW